MAKTLELWTDGACAGNPGPGGWGYLTNDGQLRKAGGALDTTNQRMELMAAARGLMAIGRNKEYKGLMAAGHLTTVEVVSDSRYLVDCFEKGWHRGWVKRGWVTATKEPVKNQDIWKPLVELVAAFEARGVTVKFRWVKGHSRHLLNQEADKLAVSGRDAAKAELIKRRQG